MSRCIEPLESRRLFALPDAVFAQPSDTYSLTIGTTLSTTAITSVSWGINAPPGGQPQPQEFAITLPSGPSSITLLNLTLLHTPIQSAVVDSQTDTTRLRTRWEMRDARVTSFLQSTGDDGALYDAITLTFERLINSYFVPNPFGGPDVETRQDFDFTRGTGTNLALSSNSYMSTAPDVRSTIEFAAGQLPLDGYGFSVTGVPPSTTGASFSATASVDGVPLWSKLANQRLIDTPVVYQNRDSQARPVVRTRFDNSFITSYAFYDSVQDGSARVEAYVLAPQQFQTISYTYNGPGNMNAPTSTGYNFANQHNYNPTPGTAFIKPPTFGPRNTAVSSIGIQFTHAAPGLTLSNFRLENLVATGLSLNTSDGGLNWTLSGNLAAQQSSDGDYGVKLFAVGSGINAGGSPLIGSTGRKWTLDTSAPAITTSDFEYEFRQALNFRFTEDVSASVSVGDVVVRNITNNTIIPAGAMALAYDTLTNIATITFPGLANGILPNGDYEATISAANVSDPAGNTLAASHQLDFFFIQGDANHDHRIDFDDFVITDFGFNTVASGFSNGDFNYDGVIDFDDYVILDLAFNMQ